MNADRFTFYIKNPAHLYQITYTELKSLVLLYPYCQNLRYLLLKKSILEKHQESDRNLQLAATYSNDRNFLYRQIKDGDSYLSEADSFLLKEDYLELKELRPASENIELTTPEPEMEIKSGDSSTDNIPKASMKASEVIISLLPNEEIVPEAEPFNYLEQIEEDEIVDITDEMGGIFVIDAIENPEFEKDTKYEVDKEEITASTNKEKEEIGKDEAISIEELIKLDSLSPLERWEKSKPTQKKKKKDKKGDHNTGMKKKNTDFEKIDALIEKTKKDVPLEITNTDIINIEEAKVPKPSPKSSFSSWLKQFQPPEEKVEEEETFVIPESKIEEPVHKIEEPVRKKDKKKKKNPDKIKKTKASKGIKEKKKKEAVTKSPTVKIDKIPEKVKKIAERSLIQSSEIVSETLAKLLVKQENYKQAIKMYDKLSLIFPEKSGFFANQIKKLKNL